MIVDDDEDTRDIINNICKSDYEVVEANDGLDALEKLERYQPDLIIMDVLMPLMDGLEASRAIREDPKYSSIPIIFLSALATKEDMQKGYLSGGDLYIPKPLNPPHFLTLVQNFIKKTPMPIEKKQYTMEQLQEMEKPKAPDAAPAPPSKPDDTKFQKIAARQPVPFHRPNPYEQISLQQPPRVMIVDDEKDMLELLRITLQEDFEVVKASDGIEAIKKVISYQPDLFILDIMLPKMSGFQLCQSLRRNITYQNAPIVMISAKSSKKDQDYAFRMGTDAYLAKPFNTKDLLKVVSEVIRRKNMSIRPKKFTIEYIQKEEEKEKSSLDAKEERFIKRKEERDQK